MAEVGIVLAVLPLVIAAADHYSKAASAFSRYHRFTSELSYLSTRLKVQRAIFNAACKKLVSLCVGQEEAGRMLEDSKHPSWTDPTIGRAFATQLGDIWDAFVDSLHLINDRLKDLETECQRFEDVIDESQGVRHYPYLLDNRFRLHFIQGEPGDARRWSRLVGKKIKFVFRDSHIRMLFDSVRDLTEDFCTLIAQTDPSETKRSIILPDAVFRGELARFDLIKTAAENLYKALGAGCTKHTEHQVHFSLRPSYSGSSSEVRFNIAFRQLLVGCSGSNFRPTWLTIESRISGSLTSVSESPAGLHNPSNALKRNLESPSPPPSRPSNKRRKTVRFRSLTPPPSCKTSQLDPSLPNLCAQNNLCNQLSHFLNQSLAGPDRCIGLIGDSSNSKHLIYLDSRAQSLTKSFAPSAASSLKDVLQRVQQTNMPNNSIPQLERIRLAKQLAMALLSFHATSWLKSTWCSDDVFFHGIDSKMAQYSSKLNDPYVDVAIKGHCAPISRSSTLPCRNFAPNPFLFGLGVMLLEIAFEAPLRSLRQPVDIDADQEDRHTEFFTAKRVSKMAARPLGGRYTKIIRRCLSCDFGRGDDLNEIALQEAVYRDVVHELDQLEEKLRRFNLDE